MARNANYIHDDAAYQAAIQNRIKQNAKVGRTKRWFAEDPSREELIKKLYSETNNQFFNNMCDAFEQWGSLTAGQEAAVRKSFANSEVRRQEYIEQGKKSQFVGEVKVRRTFTLTLFKVYSIETDFGMAVVHKFKDADENLITWKASNRLEGMEVGETKNIVATVKSHYTSKDGVNTTFINRAKLA